MSSHHTKGTGSWVFWLLAAVLALLAAAAGNRFLAMVTAPGTKQEAEPQPETTEQVRGGPEQIINRAATAITRKETAGEESVSEDRDSMSAGILRKVAEEAQRREEERRRAEKAADWRLILVNSKHPIPEDYKVPTAYTELGLQVDKRCVKELEQMLADCRKAGNDPKICSAYRDTGLQRTLYNNSVWNYMGQGLSRKEAEKRTREEMALPGTSEHELGLAVDIGSVSNERLNREQEKTGTQKWLMKNSWKYGFILRYPTDKKAITGISYEPWHYRYVGKEHAREIYEQGLCLEEYLEQ